MIRKVVVSGAIGAAMEWYDFLLYGTASALVFGKVFFADADPLIGLLASFSTFAVGFFARPVGGLIFGRLGDRIGRRPVVILTLGLMLVSTTLIGLIPDFNTIGIWAPLMLVLLRIVQGLGVGAEYAGSSVLALEHSPEGRRGFWGAIPIMGSGFGIAIGSVVFTPFTLLPEAEFLAWGWRIPFLLSILALPVGVYLRRKVSETPTFERLVEAEVHPRTPVAQLFTEQPKAVITAIMASFGPNVSQYIPSVYALSYITTNVGMAAWIGTCGVLIATALRMVTLPLSGWLSDRVGRKPVFLAGAVGCAACAFPFFWLLNTGLVIWVWVGMVLIYTFCNDLMLGPQTTLLAEQFHSRVRFTGVAIGREAGGALAGGTLPFIAVALTAATHSTWAISLVMIAFCTIAAIGAATMRENGKLSLEELDQVSTAPGLTHPAPEAELA
jgi:MHS family shikimate/dehydroshikimate transporter-like MFS transporter